MWPFTSSNKQANEGASDNLELRPPTEIVQTSVGAAILPYVIQEDPVIKKQLSQSYNRLSLSPFSRILYVGGLTGIVGFGQGMKKGSDVAVLCYRAENAHLTPTSKAGWYLYAKSKNYHAVIGGVKQGCKTGARFFGWSALFLSLEGGLDAARGRAFASRKEDENGELRRGQADFLSTVSAAVAVAGIYSWWTGMDRFASSRITSKATKGALAYGLGQDALAWIKGEKMWYINGISRLVGMENEDAVSELETKRI